MGKKQKKKSEDQFTRAEFLEFLLGASVALFLSYPAIVGLSHFVTLERALLLFGSTVVATLMFLRLRRVHRLFWRLISTGGVSFLVTLIYFDAVLNIIPANIRFTWLFLVAWSASFVGSLTLDMLRSD